MESTRSDGHSMANGDSLSAEQIWIELQQAEENCRRSAKEGLALVERNAKLTAELELVRASFEKIQTEKEHAEQSLKDALQSQRLLSDIGDEQEEHLRKIMSHTSELSRHQLQGLSTDNRRLQTDCAHALEQFKQLEQEHIVLAEEHKALIQKHAVTKDELRTLNKDTQQMSADYSNLQSENVSLQSQLVNLKQRQIEFESTKLEVMQLLDEKSALDAELLEMQKLYEIFQSQNSSLLQSLESERELKQALRRELDVHESESQSRATMEAYALQFEQTANDFPMSVKTNPAESTSTGDNFSGDSLFDELKSHWRPQEGSTNTEASGEVQRLTDELKTNRDQLYRREQWCKVLYNQMSDSLKVLQHLIALATTTESHASVDHEASSLIFKDVNARISSILTELSSLADDSGLKAGELTGAMTTMNSLDLQSLQQLKTKCAQLASQRDVRQAEVSTCCADLAVLMTLLTDTSRIVDEALLKSDAVLTRLNVNDHSTDNQQQQQQQVSKRVSVRELLKSKHAQDLADKYKLGQINAGQLLLVIETLNERLQRVLVPTIPSSVSTTDESVAPTDDNDVLLTQKTNERVAELEKENVDLKSIASTQRQQIYSLRESLKNTSDTAEQSLTNLKAIYDNEKLHARESIAKIRQELNQRKEDAATFASYRSMLTARNAEYVTQIENLQRKHKAVEQEKQTLSGLVHLAIRQKLSLIERLQELESHLDAVTLNQANDADTAAPGAFMNTRGGGSGRARNDHGRGARRGVPNNNVYNNNAASTARISHNANSSHNNNSNGNRRSAFSNHAFPDNETRGPNRQQ